MKCYCRERRGVLPIDRDCRRPSCPKCDRHSTVGPIRPVPSEDGPGEMNKAG